jgi:hypothetical protein
LALVSLSLSLFFVGNSLFVWVCGYVRVRVYAYACVCYVCVYSRYVRGRVRGRVVCASVRELGQEQDEGRRGAQRSATDGGTRLSD